MFWQKDQKPKVHLIGIGGSGMSGIAEVLLASGFEVSGSDLNLSATTSRLKELGAQIFKGHDEQNLGAATVVVISSAVKKDNPEWLEAIKQGVPVIARAEMLAELMRLKRGVAVAGSHGKTTTTSILGQILRPLDPTVVVGGRLQHWGASSIVGSGELFVIEADESDRSFLKFSPVYTIVTNIDLEHLETYKNLEDIEETFVQFLNRTAFFGMNWIGADCISLKRIRSRLKKPTKTFGFEDDADLKIENLKFKGRKSFFELNFEGKHLGYFETPLLGRHNILNATSAIGMALTLGLSADEIRETCRDLKGADRRLQVHSENADLAIVEDYGHHPTEIKATLEALALMYPEREKVVCFQPHRYTRTKALWNDFAESFKEGCDHLYLFPIYSAHEPIIKGITSEMLATTFGQFSIEVFSHVPCSEDLYEKIQSRSAKPRVVLILGAGPLTQLAKDLVSLETGITAQRHAV